MSEEIKTVAHIVTQEDLDNNPELAEQGIKLGETIQIPEGELIPEGVLADQPEEQINEIPKQEPETQVTPKTFYNGQEVVERLGKFDADGAEECKLADGSTAFVPKSILGE